MQIVANGPVKRRLKDGGMEDINRLQLQGWMLPFSLKNLCALLAQFTSAPIEIFCRNRNDEVIETLSWSCEAGWNRT